MVVNKRKIGMYTIAGVLAAVIIVGSLFLSGIQFPGQSGMGTLVVSIKDAPVELDRLMITVTGLYVQSSTEDSWVELELNSDIEAKPFDLLALRYVSEELSNQQLKSGDYSKIRIEVDEATAYYEDAPDDAITLKVPPGHIDIIVKFSVESGYTTNLVIDMQPDTTAISSSGNFRPIVKATATNQGEPISTPTPTPTPTPTA